MSEHVYVHVENLSDDSEKPPCTGAFWLWPEHVHDFLVKAAQPGIGLVIGCVTTERHMLAKEPPAPPYARDGYRVFLVPRTGRDTRPFLGF